MYLRQERKQECVEFIRKNSDKVGAIQLAAQLRVSPSFVFRTQIAIGVREKKPAPTKVKKIRSRFFRYKNELELFIGKR